MQIKIRILFLSFLCYFVAAQSFAQTQTIEPEEKDPEAEEFTEKKWKDKIIVGGNVSAQFGNATFIEISPLVGYRITEDLTSGVGFTYQYLSENYNIYNFYDYKATVMGARIFSQYDLLFGIFAHAEYEYSWYKFTYEDVNLGEYSGAVPAFFVGGGYSYQISDNARFQIMALYDVLHSAESIYINPWSIRMGFNIGL